MLRTLLSILILAHILTGCDLVNKKSDYVGGFATQSGNCKEVGDSSIIFSEQDIEIGFYCFLKKCAHMEGKTHQGGFFHLTDSEGYYIEGKITQYEASGSWFLKMKGQNCSGYWTALKN
ncbi:MAG: hypothetical protein RPR40_01135 [Bermanella sp.]